MVSAVCEAEAARILWGCTSGELSSAIELYQAMAEALGMPPLQAHCHCGLGTFYARLGQWEQARPTLRAALDLYRAMAMTFWLPPVETTLAQTG